VSQYVFPACAAGPTATSISACQRRRAMGESADALLVALTTWPARGAGGVGVQLLGGHGRADQDHGAEAFRGLESVVTVVPVPVPA